MKAIIFDMDGVIVDSEPLWKKAEKEVFSSLGVKMNDELCEITKKMTTDQVTRFWFERNPWKEKTIKEVENLVIDKVIYLIEKENCIFAGLKKLIEKLKAQGFQLAIATNSPYKIIPKVLNKVDLSNTFDIISSSEYEKNGKPNPDVYITTIKKLNKKAHECIAIEDSNSGIIAAKRAGLKVIAFRNNNKNLISEKVDFEIQDYRNINLEIFK